MDLKTVRLITAIQEADSRPRLYPRGDATPDLIDALAEAVLELLKAQA